MTQELRLEDLSKKARKALDAALSGETPTRENISKLSVRKIRLMEGFGRKTGEEIQTWARQYGIEIPEWGEP